jgi:hypothetical protein
MCQHSNHVVHEHVLLHHYDVNGNEHGHCPPALHAELNGEKRRPANHRHQMQAKFVAEVSPHQHWTK